MSIWDWTLHAYGCPGVPEVTLRLQDAFGQNTDLLLWAVWAETADAALLAQAVDLTRTWETTALIPLRDARRALKVPVAPVHEEARERLREDVRAAELHAERVLMETLGGLSGDHKGGAHALDALKAASAAWNPPAPDTELAALAVALS